MSPKTRFFQTPSPIDMALVWASPSMQRYIIIKGLVLKVIPIALISFATIAYQTLYFEDKTFPVALTNLLLGVSSFAISNYTTRKMRGRMIFFNLLPLIIGIHTITDTGGILALQTAKYLNLSIINQKFFAISGRIIAHLPIIPTYYSQLKILTHRIIIH